MKTYTIETKLIRYVVPVLAALFLAGCSSQPSESTGQKIIEKRIQAQSRGLIKLLSFRKTNALVSDNLYQMEFEIEIEYLDNCLVGSLGGGFGSLPDFTAEPGSSLPASKFYMQQKRKGEREKQSGQMGFVKTENGWRGTDSEVAMHLEQAPRPASPVITFVPPPAAAAPSSSGSQIDISAKFNSESKGSSFGIRSVSTPTGHGASFSRTAESRIEYSFENGFPTQGTLEWRILVNNGYRYAGGELTASSPDALVFTTVGPDTWLPGCSWLTLSRDGTVNFGLGENVDGQIAARNLAAKGTSFRFGEWHTVGISFGSEGRSINVDGRVVARDTLTQPLGAGGPGDKPTIGKMVSRSWPNNQHDGGFDGVVDAFRASHKQADWKLCK